MVGYTALVLTSPSRPVSSLSLVPAVLSRRLAILSLYAFGSLALTTRNSMYLLLSIATVDFTSFSS